jgi:hypothetical protein
MSDGWMAKRRAVGGPTPPLVWLVPRAHPAWPATCEQVAIHPRAEAISRCPPYTRVHVPDGRHRGCNPGLALRVLEERRS